MSMYGSIHSHFEDNYDATTDMKTAVMNYYKAGCKKVAATGHGIFSQFEDLKDIEKELKKADKNFDLEIIPGIEGYFGENAAHMILIAKDYEGYVSLSHIISDSAYHVEGSKPIITLENLKENVKKGHIVCTSACIAGIFGNDMGLTVKNLEQSIEETKKKINGNYSEIKKNAILYLDAKAIKRPTVKDKTAAEKEFKKTGVRTLLDEWEARNAVYLEAQATLEAMPENILEQVKQYNSYAKHEAEIEENQRKIDEFYETEEERLQKAEVLYKELENIFGKENFYFEIQNHGIDCEKTIYNNIIKFAARVHNLHLIASNDVHLGVTKQDPEYETELLKRQVEKYRRFNTYEPPTADDPEYCIKTDEELKEELLKIIEDRGNITKEALVDSAINNIRGVLSQCHVYFPEQQYEDTKDESLKPNHYPKICENENEEFIRLVHEGIKVKFPKGFPSPEYEERMNHEIDVITRMGYAGYHLIVQDYLAYGRLLGYLNPDEIESAPLSIEELEKYLNDTNNTRIGHGIGPGRGSAAGSLCCYLLGITDVDPIKYDLLFERFLNVERVSMPDIDSDFKTDIREKVISYCENKYGKDNVCRIMTKLYGASKQDATKDEEEQEDNRMSRGNIRQAARYLAAEEIYNRKQTNSIDDEEAKKLEKTYAYEAGKLSNRFAELITLKDNEGNAFDANKVFRILEKEVAETSETPEIDLKILKIAIKIDGLFTGYGQHAAGVIISKDPIRDIIPLSYNTVKGNIQTQCQMAQAEAKGLLKMDFLGLTNLDIITNITKYPTREKDIDKHLQIYEDREKIFANPAIYSDIFATAQTQGIFQFEGNAMKRYLRALQPECFEDIVLLNAANRPGPMAYIPEITAWKWYNKFNGDYEQYSAKIKEIYPFSEEKRQQAINAGLEYEYSKFYDDNGNVLEKPQKTITIDCKALQNILAPTYGCPIYQEQIMRIFQDMAGYSLGGADVVRRYMSKKKKDKLAHEKQTFIYGDEERGIEGCMKKQGLTEAQAAELFEQMMPFAEYGFNKSHALAYSQVALYTAYLKRYHTYDFYRYSLNAVKSLEEIDAFIAEMRQRGIKLLPPDIMKSKNDFTVEYRDDNTGRADIRYGLSVIKGVGVQNIVFPTKCVQEFILKNPDVDISAVKDFAKLGMFETRWIRPDEKRVAKEKWLINGSRKAILDWIEKYGDNTKKLMKSTDKVKFLEEELTKLEEGSPEYEAKTKEISRAQTSLTNLREKMNAECAADPECYVTEAYWKGKPHEVSEAEIKADRKAEVEMTRNCFSVRGSYEKLQKLNNKTTFADVERTHKGLAVPCIILSVDEVPSYTKKMTPFYNATLMDMRGHIVIRRFDTPLTGMNEGVLKIYPEEKKFLISREEPQPLSVSFGENSRREEPLPEYHKTSAKRQEQKDFFQKATRNEEKSGESDIPGIEDI